MCISVSFDIPAICLLFIIPCKYYGSLFTLHFPLSLYLNVPYTAVPKQTSGDVQMSTVLQKVDWGQLAVETVSNYMHTTDVLLKYLVLADGVITCSGGHFTNQCHVDMLSNTYGHIMTCLRIPKKHKKRFTPVPGSNQYLSEPYKESKQAYIRWSSYNKPRSGPVHEIMKITRARFKYAQRLVGKNEEALRADALANKLNSGNVKCFWKTVKSYNSGVVKNSNQIENVSGTDNILNMWRDHFKSLYNSVQDVTDKPGVLSYIQNDMGDENICVTVNAISASINELPNDKSPRIDGLMSEHFKNASYRLNVALSVSLQAMLKHGFLPKQFMLTMIVQILKSKNGDITSKSNYGPIALATVCSKIMEMFIVKQMSDYLWTTDNQFAYKKGYSTEMCIFLLKECIRHYCSHKTPVYTCFLDARKAFDCINHCKLFQILVERKCPVYILRVLEFWYQESMLCVKWGDSLSEFFSVSNGIKQGGILSPKLFNIYVDVLSQGLTSKPVGCSCNGKIINHLYYADDLVLIAPSSNGMQKLVTECESFANKYWLKFNEMKSVLLFFKPVGFKLNPFLRICLNGVPIPNETSCRYLGHIITNNLSDNGDIRRQLRCFYGRSNMLLRTFVACSYDVKLLLFMWYGGSMYTSSIWCKYTKKQYYQMEVAYNNVFRRFCGYDRFSSASQMFVENRVDNFGARMRRLIYGFPWKIICLRKLSSHSFI